MNSVRGAGARKSGEEKATEEMGCVPLEVGELFVEKVFKVKVDDRIVQETLWLKTALIFCGKKNAIGRPRWPINESKIGKYNRYEFTENHNYYQFDSSTDVLISFDNQLIETTIS